MRMHLLASFAALIPVLFDREPPMALRHRKPVLSERTVNALSRPLVWLHRPVVTAVVLQGTGSHGHFGGLVAAPVFSKVMGFALRAYEVPPTATKPTPYRLSVPD